MNDDVIPYDCHTLTHDKLNLTGSHHHVHLDMSMQDRLNSNKDKLSINSADVQEDKRRDSEESANT